MKPFLEHDMCMGCKACGDACPVQAISYPQDEEGFWHPAIDEARCIDCHRCERACPIVQRPRQQVENIERPKVYAAYHVNQAIRYNSTSGGLYYAVAESFLEKKSGWLAGCAYTDDLSRAVHIVAKDRAGLQKIMRSKYFQSDTEGIYRQVKELLTSGNRVLFCGAPCQVAALYQYLGKPYEGLYTLDFVCRGINTPLAYQSYKKELEERYHARLQEVRFKDKSHGWTKLGTKIRMSNGIEFYRNRYNDPWVNGFIVGNLYMRPSCSTCQFKIFPRPADMTIGDFWGIALTDEEKKYGLSLAMVNNARGAELLELAKDCLTIREEDLEAARKGNPALLRPVAPSSKRKEFFAHLKTMPYSKAVWKTMGLAWPRWQLRAWKMQLHARLGSWKQKVRGGTGNG